MENKIKIAHWFIAATTVATLAIMAATLWLLPGQINSVTRPAAWITGIAWGVLASGWLAGNLLMISKCINLLRSQCAAQEKEKQETKESERNDAALARAEATRQRINQEFMTTTFVNLLKETKLTTTTHTEEETKGKKQPEKVVTETRPLDGKRLADLIECYQEFINSKPA